VIKEILIKQFSVVNINKEFDSENLHLPLDQRHRFFNLDEKLNEIRPENRAIIGFTKKLFDKQYPGVEIQNAPLLNGNPGKQYAYAIRGKFNSWDKQIANPKINYQANTLISQHQGYIMLYPTFIR
jgi:hypothetical protein